MLLMAIFLVLKELSGLIIPLVLAALLTILNLPLVNLMERWKIPRILITLLVAIITIAFLWLIISMLSSTVEQIIRDKNFLARQFTRKIDASIVWVGNTVPGVNVEFIQTQINSVISPGNIADLIGSVIGTLGNIGSSSLLFLLYYFILLSGATGYKAYLDYVIGSDDSGETREIWNLTEESIAAYMSIKTLISLGTGIVTAFICWIFGLQYALFWGFLAFVLNFIPSIGSLVATAFPIFMAIIQFNSFGVILAMGLLLGLTQFLIGSVLDPMIMGNRLRLNTVTVIFGLLFWGYIWGIPGMLLSVPLLVMMRLLLERSEDMAIIARLMGNPVKPGRRKPSLYARILSRQKEKT